MSIAAQITEWVFSSPFLWMVLLGIVAAHSMRRHTIAVSMPYAPLLEEKDENRLSGRMMLSFLMGIIAALAIYFTSAVLSYFFAVGIWLTSFIFITKSKESIAFPAAAYIIGIIFFFTQDSSEVYKVIRTASIYQITFGCLYLFGKKETYPIMQQGKDGKIYGEHLFNQVWVMPAVALSLSAAGMTFLPYSMLIYLLFSDVRIKHTLPKKYFSERGIFMLASGAFLLALSFIYNGIVQSAVIFAVLPVIIVLQYIKESRFVKKAGNIYIASEKGVQVFYVYCDSPATHMGLEIGDLITSINGNTIISFEAIEKVLEERPPYVWLNYIRGGKTYETEYKDYANGIESLGFVSTPKNPSKFELYPRKGFFGRVLKNITGSFHRRG